MCHRTCTKDMHRAQLISGVEFEIDTNIPIFDIIFKHVSIQINLTRRQYDFFQFHIGQLSYQASCKDCLIFLQSPLRFHLSINFIFSQTCICQHGCEKYSNLCCSNKWKMDLQVKNLKVDISATPRKNSLCHRSLSSPARQRQITHSPS